MLACAQAVWDDLQRHSILPALLGGHVPDHGSDDEHGDEEQQEEAASAALNNAECGVGGGPGARANGADSSGSGSGAHRNDSGSRKRGSSQNAAGSRLSTMSDPEAQARGPEEAEAAGGGDHVKCAL